jgi:hypothetical protein
MSIKTKYFLIAVVLIGSIGIWLPIGLELLIEKKVTFHNIPSNTITYFVSLLFAGCIDYFLGKIQQLNIDGIIGVFFNLISISLLGIALVVGAIVLNIYKYDLYSLILGLIGIFISYRIWWIANEGNPNFTPSNATLGGDALKSLSNG